MASQKPKDLFLLEGISQMCFNKDYSQVAICKKDEKIYIYKVESLTDTNKWTLIDTLKNHVLYISGLDWCPLTNQILSVSHDKIASVWTFENNKVWKPENVVQNLKVGYLCCKWNNKGTKFLAGTSANQLLMGYFNKECNWWTCKHQKKLHKSSVVCVDFDNSSLYAISGSTDLKVIISSIYYPLVDGEIADTPEFGTTLFTFDPEDRAWCSAVCFMPQGDFAIASSQNSALTLIDYKNNKSETLETNQPPLTFIKPISDTQFLGVSFDKNIYSYSIEGGKIVYKDLITKPKEDKPAATESKVSGGVAARLAALQGKGMVKKKTLVVSSNKNSGLHPASISSFTVKDKQIITSDYAGFVKFWNY